VEKLTWRQGDEGMDLDQAEDEVQGRGKIVSLQDGVEKALLTLLMVQIRESTRTLYSLMFIPNCLVVK
jgi:hypothetical protein